MVSPAAIAYTKASPSDDYQQKRALFAPVMKEGSWKCVYSETEEEFEANWKSMVETCKSYGYDDAVQAALEEAQNKGVSDVYAGIIEKYNIETTDAWNDIEMGTILNAPKK